MSLKVNDNIVKFGDYNLPNTRCINGDMGVIAETTEVYPACEVADHFYFLYIFKVTTGCVLVFSNYKEVEVVGTVELFVVE